MTVVVGIVSKNRAGILPTAIESALSQNAPGVSVRVYDDNSTDNTISLKEKYPQVDWEFGQENKGYVYARNRFMSEASADFFCSLDDDSWFIKNDSLLKAINFMNTRPDVAAVAFDILSPDRPNEVSESSPVEVAYFIGCGHLIRLSCLKSVGCYKSLPGYYGGEEKDLCIRLMDQGFKTMLMPGVHVWHDKTSTARNLAAQHRSGICNDLVFAYRRTPGLFLVPGLIQKFAAHTYFSLRFERGRLLGACFSGFGDFIRAWSRGLDRKPVTLNTFRRFRKMK